MGALAKLFFASDERIFLLLGVAASGISFVVMLAWFPSTLDRLVDFVQRKKNWIPTCAVILVAYLVVLVFNTTYAGYLGHVEPNIAAVSFILLKGAPLYHSLASTQRYSLLYGPMAYLPYTLALRVMGANVLSLKLVVLFVNLCLLWLLWRCYRQLLDPPGALLVLVGVVAFLLVSNTYVFQVRGDILIVLSVALGLFAVLSTSPWMSALLLALACGFAFDIKFTALFYFLPLYVLFIRRHGWRPAALTSIAAAVLAVLPFLFPEISAAGYLEWVRQASRHGLFARVEVSRELKLLPFVCAPAVLLLWQLAQINRSLVLRYLQKNQIPLIVLGVCFAAVAVFASKIGAGPHHFMPFYPVAGYVCADLYREIKTAPDTRFVSPRLSLIPLLWFWLAMALAAQLGADFSSTASRLLTSRSAARKATDDLETVMKNHPGQKIEMGYGRWDSGYELTFFRPALVFAGNPLTIDAVALADMQLSGVDIPRSTLEYLEQCKTQIWLIPKGEPPFVTVNVYSLMEPRVFPERSLFSDEFRGIFFRHYLKKGSSRYYDLWECGPKLGQQANLNDRRGDAFSNLRTKEP
jgi:hypothetical protein